MTINYFYKKIKNQIQPLIKKYLNDSSDDFNIFINYARFKRKIRRVFIFIN